MAKGNAVQGLLDIVLEAGCTLEGVGIAIEKGFQGGGDRVKERGIKYKALAVVDKINDDNTIVFRED